MKISDIVTLLDVQFFTQNIDTNKEIKYAFGSDLMSDVLAKVHGDILLITGLANIQTIRTAEMTDIKYILFVRGKKPTLDVINLAEEKDIKLMGTKEILFTACGLLYNAGVEGAETNI